MRNNVRRTGLRILAACFCFLLLTLSACRKEEGVSTGHSDNIEGFLFVFDTRNTTSALVNAMRRGEMPESIRIVRAETETDITDVQRIRDIYYYMSDLIIVGQTTIRREDAAFSVIYHMKDGTEAQFDFETKSYLRLGDQNYMIETDGKLWPLLEE